MKLRIDPTQIRFRLTSIDAENLLKELIVSETLHLPFGKKLHYLIKISDSIDLNYADNTLILSVPMKDFQQLIQNPSKNGLSSTYKAQDKHIAFSIQIDMPCDLNC